MCPANIITDIVALATAPKLSIKQFFPIIASVTYSGLPHVILLRFLILNQTVTTEETARTRPEKVEDLLIVRRDAKFLMSFIPGFLLSILDRKISKILGLFL